jgi:hypothetical protein
LSAGVVFAATVLPGSWLRRLPGLRDWAWATAPGFYLWLFVAGAVAVTVLFACLAGRVTSVREADPDLVR